MVVGGLVAEAAAWWLVAARDRSVWAVVTPVLVALGIAAVVVGPPAWSPDVEPILALAAGVAAGVALYLGTRAFVHAVRGWVAFRLDSIALYRRRGSMTLPMALGLSVVLAVSGEELFWRGLFQDEVADALDGRTLLAAGLTWAAFVLANLPSANLAIVAGVIVGGGVWSILGWWCGGALAPLVCHAVWTTLMLSFPVVRSAAATR